MRTHLGRRLTRHFPISTFVAGVVFLWLYYGVLSAEAENLFWAPSGPPFGDWFTAANWTVSPRPSPVPGRVPTPADTATVSGTQASNIGGPLSTGSTGVANELLIGATSSTGVLTSGEVFVTGSTASLTLSGTSLSLDVVDGSLIIGGGIVNAQAVTVGANGEIDIGNGTTGTFNATSITNNNLINVTNTGTTTLSATISGFGRIFKDGSGTLILGGNNPNFYFGATTIVNGSVVAAKSGALGRGDVSVFEPATLVIN